MKENRVKTERYLLWDTSPDFSPGFVARRVRRRKDTEIGLSLTEAYLTVRRGRRSPIDTVFADGWRAAVEPW